MSGRMHPFLYSGQREKLVEFATFLELPQEDTTYSHLLKEGAAVLYDLWKAGSLTEEQLTEVKDVQDPTQKLERKTTVFLNEGVIKRLDAMGEALGTDVHDNGSAHLMQFGFRIIFQDWKDNKLDDKRIAALKQVFKPRGVYHI